ncbi:hypothetical protein L210DRAFT_3647385 [Boletus edulis BED1]|uniref:DNA/RNA-binding domain-containing protein n=1 Tax=Boletus edulis BED1 TaxID=1328754 RepID=A0AAD4BRW9_BOLED|nr:hypothetical protein L210DRAFT_3647385 [Boletus edulis BED1]
MSGDETEHSTPSEGAKRKRSFSPHYTSSHSSRSSSFNASAAEIILGLFQEDAIAHIGPSYYEEDDPSVREALVLQQAQNPESWVRKTLARPELWKDAADPESDTVGDIHCVKRARSDSGSRKDAKEYGDNERKLQKSAQSGDVADSRRKLSDSAVLTTTADSEAARALRSRDIVTDHPTLKRRRSDEHDLPQTPHRGFGGNTVNCDKASSVPMQPLRPMKQRRLQSPIDIFGPQTAHRHWQSENRFEELPLGATDAPSQHQCGFKDPFTAVSAERRPPRSIAKVNGLCPDLAWSYAATRAAKQPVLYGPPLLVARSSFTLSTPQILLRMWTSMAEGFAIDEQHKQREDYQPDCAQVLAPLQTQTANADVDSNDIDSNDVDPNDIPPGPRPTTADDFSDDDDDWPILSLSPRPSSLPHISRLADMMHNLMEISLAPSVPASLRVIPTKYIIIIRLSTHAFHRLLEALRRASFACPLALEHLQDFIYFAYTFYTGLLEEPTLKSFRAGWLEALGDLARYRMAVAAMVTSNQLSGSALTVDAVSQANTALADNVSDAQKSKLQISVRSSSYRPAARIDNSPTPSVGIVAARMMQVEPEKERWRGIAKEWYAHGIADTPGTGKLHHHLGLLSRVVETEEVRAVYHFVKSMTVLQWITMAVTNVGALLEYSRPGDVLRRAGGTGTRDATSTFPFRAFTKRNVPAQPEEDPEEKQMDVDDDAAKPDIQVCNAALVSMLSLVLRNPTRKSSPFAESTLNPYLTVLLTFLTTVSKHAETLAILERFIPWEDLAVFFALIPKNMLASQGLHISTPTGTERWVMLTSGCAPPLPEDWCMRGMEWVGRKGFERGYWKSGEDHEDADERGNELKLTLRVPAVDRASFIFKSSFVQPPCVTDK